MCAQQSNMSMFCTRHSIVFTGSPGMFAGLPEKMLAGWLGEILQKR
jgi:hypothetical protein